MPRTRAYRPYRLKFELRPVGVEVADTERERQEREAQAVVDREDEEFLRRERGGRR